jgi:hypothetical protein
MSQLATLRPLSRPAVGRRSQAPTLRVVTPDLAKGQYGFVALCLALLIGGLVAGLLLNTSMAKGSFVLGDLQHRSSELADTEDALNHAIDAQSAPAELAQRALGLGMVPAQNPAFLRMSDGRVLGVAEPAKAKDGFTVVAQGTAASVPAATASGKAVTKPAVAPVGPSTTVKTSGSVTTTTVTLVKATVVEQTITSVDKKTGRTTSTTITTPRKAATPAKTPKAPSTKPAAAPKATAPSH